MSCTPLAARFGDYLHRGQTKYAWSTRVTLSFQPRVERRWAEGRSGKKIVCAPPRSIHQIPTRAPPQETNCPKVTSSGLGFGFPCSGHGPELCVSRGGRVRRSSAAIPPYDAPECCIVRVVYTTHVAARLILSLANSCFFGIASAGCSWTVKQKVFPRMERSIGCGLAAASRRTVWLGPRDWASPSTRPPSGGDIRRHKDRGAVRDQPLLQRPTASTTSKSQRWQGTGGYDVYTCRGSAAWWHPALGQQTQMPCPGHQGLAMGPWQDA